ncbi:MAG: molybdopterin-dependent oxidoreductase [Acidimicrobiaceae bacterium]|nr:molybdopterin-dependent oxidoreductase [Acidimicrobiaceae bacterium]
MCLVECDSGRGPAVTVSCMVPVAPDMKIDTQSPTTKRMQEGVLELLLANHPLDCPVCDKGGECPLQDQAFSNGPGESRYVEEKRHYEKPIAISDIVYLDRERCILCDRCTRFADEVAGDALIHFSSRGNNTYITTFPDEPFSSYFSGNTVQICPVGALTAKPYRFKARPWDLSQQETTCTTCAVGCRTVVQSSRDEVLRYMGVDSDPVNHGWLCDRGRFNFEAVKSEHRVLQPLVREGDELLPASWNTALAAAAALITEAKAAGGVAGIAVIGGARGTNEDAFAWARVGHEVIGTPNVYSQMGDGLPVGLLGLDRATIDEAANATTIVLLGPDLKEELPVLYLRLRDAAAKQRSRIIELTPKHTGLTRNAWRSIGYEPGTQVAAVQGALADGAIAAQLAKGNVVIVAGRANLAESSAATIAALHALLAAVPGAKVLPAFRRGNVVGALQVGVRPGKGGLDTRGALLAAADGKIECLVLLGADPLADFPDTDLARRALAGARRIIAVDTFLTQSSQRADGGAGRERIRGEVGYHHQPGRQGQHRGPSGHPRRLHTPRLDDRHRVGARARWRPRLRQRGGCHRRHRRQGGGVRISHRRGSGCRRQWCAGGCTGGHRSDQRRRSRRARAQRLRLPSRRQPHPVRPGDGYGQLALARRVASRLGGAPASARSRASRHHGGYRREGHRPSVHRGVHRRRRRDGAARHRLRALQQPRPQRR